MPRDLETICLRALRKEPANRYDSAAAMADDIQRFLDGRPVVARPVGPLEKTAKWCRRNKVIAATIALATTLVCVTAVLGVRSTLIERNRFRRERDAAVANLYDALVGEARATRLARGAEYREKVTAAISQALELEAPQTDKTLLRREIVACMGDFVGNEPITWTVPDSALFVSASCCPDRDSIVLGHRDGSLSERDLHSGEILASWTGHRFGIYECALSPDGRYLASADDHGAVLIWERDPSGDWQEIAQHTIAESFRLNFVKAVTLAFSNDGQVLWTCAKAETFITKIDIAANSSTRVFESKERSPIFRFALDPTGAYLTIVQYDERISLYETESKKRIAEISLGDVSVFDVVFSPDGKRFAAATLSGARVFDTTTQKEIADVPGDRLLTLGFSPDGRQLVLPSSGRNVVRLWDLITKREVAVLDMPAYDAGMTPNGRFLWSVSAVRANAWSLYDKSEVMPLAGHEGGISGIAFDRHGRRVATTGNDGWLRVHDLTTAKQTNAAKIHVVVDVFCPDGQNLVAHDGKHVFVLDVTSGGEIKTAKSMSHGLMPPVGHVVFDRDWSRMAIPGRDGLRVWKTNGWATRPDVENQENEPFQTVSDKSVGSVSFSTNARRLAFVDRDAFVHLWDLEAGRLLPDPKIKSTVPFGLCFLPNSDDLVVAGRRGGVAVWDINKNKRKQTLIDVPDADEVDRTVHVWLDDDTQQLIYQWGTDVSVWDLEQRKELVTLRKQNSLPNHIAWGGKGRFIGIGKANGSLSVWDLEGVRASLEKLGLAW